MKYVSCETTGQYMFRYYIVSAADNWSQHCYLARLASYATAVSVCIG